MTTFPAEHQGRLQAADGWLGLGNWVSANSELDELPPLLRAHPQVLALRARIYEAAGRWDVAEEIGRKIAETPAVDTELLLALARCSCALGKPAEARSRLALAFELDDSREFKLRALDDAALAKAWTEEDP